MPGHDTATATMHAGIAIVQRQTLDWDGMTEARYRELSVPFCRLWERPDDYMLRFVTLWNRSFGLDYFQVRARQKQLASHHNAAIAGTTYIPYAGYGNLPADAAAYVFVDDDDWLSPGLATALGSSDLQAHEAAIWKCCTLGGPTSEYPLFFWGLNGRCMTNNYAVCGHWLQQLRRLPEVCQHGQACRTLPGMDVLLLDAWLSVTNKSPCSSVSLEQTLKDDCSSACLATAIDQYNARLATLQESDFERAAWAWPLFQATRALFAAVAASRQA